ncbi:hypothetical protein NSTC745_00775 [Nostoc sp. DSM 114161]
MENKLLQRITHNPDICHGKPCIRGLRYPVELILELLSSGMTNEEILADYDDLEYEDIQAVLLFAARLNPSQKHSSNCLMKFLVDAQLPVRLARFLKASVYDTIHTRDLPDQNATPDNEINAISIAENRILITKDVDFVNYFLTVQQPYKLL